MNGTLTKTLEFSAGTNEHYVLFTHSNSSTAVGVESDTGTIELILDGVNKETFSLINGPTLSFVIIASDNIVPTLTSLEMDSINKTNASLLVSVEEPVHLYYMIGLFLISSFLLALAGTKFPSFNEVYSKGPAPVSTTLSKYGLVVTFPSKTPIIIIGNQKRRQLHY